MLKKHARGIQVKEMKGEDVDVCCRQEERLLSLLNAFSFSLYFFADGFTGTVSFHDELCQSLTRCAIFSRIKVKGDREEGRERKCHEYEGNERKEKAQQALSIPYNESEDQQQE